MSSYSNIFSGSIVLPIIALDSRPDSSASAEVKQSWRAAIAQLSVLTVSTRSDLQHKGPTLQSVAGLAKQFAREVLASGL